MFLHWNSYCRGNYLNFLGSLMGCNDEVDETFNIANGTVNFHGTGFR
jgi:hypothetical protein